MCGMPIKEDKLKFTELTDDLIFRKEDLITIKDINFLKYLGLPNDRVFIAECDGKYLSKDGITPYVINKESAKQSIVFKLVSDGEICIINLK